MQNLKGGVGPPLIRDWRASPVFGTVWAAIRAQFVQIVAKTERPQESNTE
jgi:hypothetical protein